jgi:Fe-S cluster assembly iron-binding protein IscA
MLTLTETAANVLSDSRTQQGIPDDALLRVAPAQEGPERGLSLGFVDAAADGDQTGTSHGMTICVAEEVAEALDGATLDVQTSGDSAQLVLVPAD